MTKTPRRWRIASASGVVGPLAASATIRALTRSALAAVIWFSSAAGIRTSHSISSSSALVTARRTGEADDRAVLGLPGDDAVDIQAGRVVDAAARVGDGDDLGALGSAIEQRRDRAGVAEALHGDRGVVEVDAQVARRLARCSEDRSRARSPRCGPRSRPALIGLPVTTPGTVYPTCIEYVSMIQAMIWALVLTSGAGMSRSGPMSTLDLGREAAGQALELAHRELLGVDDHAALAAAVGDADDRALPGHPHRQGLDLVEGHVLVVADAALGRAAAEVVLDAVAGEDLDAAVVHLDREVDGQLAARLAQDLAQAGSRSIFSAARSNCCCATCQGLIDAATCSVVMGTMFLRVAIAGLGAIGWWASRIAGSEADQVYRRRLRADRQHDDRPVGARARRAARPTARWTGSGIMPRDKPAPRGQLVGEGVEVGGHARQHDRAFDGLGGDELQQPLARLARACAARRPSRPRRPRW